MSPPDAELPLIVYLHGRGDRPRVPRDDVYDLDTPVRMILPRGPERFGQGYAWAPVSAHRGESPELLEALDARARMLSDAMVEWQRRHPTRGRPIVLGFSQGGILAMTLAVREPGSIARAIPMAGWLPPSLLPPRADRYAVNARVIALHGGDDPVLSATRTAGTVEDLVKLGYPVELEVYPGVGHEVSRDMRRRVHELLGGGAPRAARAPRVRRRGVARAEPQAASEAFCPRGGQDACAEVPLVYPPSPHTRGRRWRRSGWS
ncbi:MAG: dienelactone hydrolase family protein [Sandaracinaceae bacterium]|nr:dienelactone hydrolase family protein [Sandaracinaceae bacterium]